MINNNKILVRSLDKENFVKEYLNSFNGYLKLTDKELDVLTGLLTIFFANLKQYDTITQPLIDKSFKVAFNAKSRKIVSKKCEMSNYNFNNILKRLRLKNVISLNDGVYSIPFQFLIDPKESQIVVTYKFILE